MSSLVKDDDLTQFLDRECARLRAEKAMLVEALERLEEKLAGNMRNVRVGDRVRVRYRDGSGLLEGIVTRVWKPSEHRVGMWQGQVNDGWCFHAHDELDEHEEAEALAKVKP